MYSEAFATNCCCPLVASYILQTWTKCRLGLDSVQTKSRLSLDQVWTNCGHSTNALCPKASLPINYGLNVNYRLLKLPSHHKSTLLLLIYGYRNTEQVAKQIYVTMLILCVFTSGSYLKLCKFNFFVTFDKDNVCTDLLVFGCSGTQKTQSCVSTVVARHSSYCIKALLISTCPRSI